MQMYRLRVVLPVDPITFLRPSIHTAFDRRPIYGSATWFYAKADLKEKNQVIEVFPNTPSISVQFSHNPLRQVYFCLTLQS